MSRTCLIFLLLCNNNLLLSLKAEDAKVISDFEIKPMQLPPAAETLDSNVTRINRQAACSWSTLDADQPFRSTTVECCDSALEANIRESIRLGINTPKLGDAAKYIQRKAQLEFGVPVEVIVSTNNFAILSYYHGMRSCKITDGKYHILVYQTPANYDPFNVHQEEYLSSVDIGEPLGGNKNLNVRGYNLDVHEYPHAGDNTAIQPQKSGINKFPNKFSQQEIDAVNALEKEKLSGTDESETSNSVIETERERRGQKLVGEHSFQDFGTLEILYDDTREANTTQRGPDANERIHNNLKWNEHPPKGTHCNSDIRGGDKCCDGPLSRTMRDAISDLSTSPQFGAENEGVIAGLVQRRAQQRFGRSYEVIVSRNEFAIASHAIGHNTCKQKYKGYYVLAYATPKQYDVDYALAENYYFTVSAREAKGSTQYSLPGMKPFHTPLALEGEGPRAGFPVGSHCDESESEGGLENFKGYGSSCCHQGLFNTMSHSYDQHIAQLNFNEYDLRAIARRIQWDTEEYMRHAMEVIVSDNDFIFRAHIAESAVCKFRVDKYYILAYEHNSTYQLHSTNEVDLGAAKPFNCPANMSAVHGLMCCDGAMQYQMYRSINDVKYSTGYNKYNIQFLANDIQYRVERLYNAPFETVVSLSTDFVWATARHSEHACKIDDGPFNALAFQSGIYPPPESDFQQPNLVQFVIAPQILPQPQPLPPTFENVIPQFVQPPPQIPPQNPFVQQVPQAPPQVAQQVAQVPPQVVQQAPLPQFAPQVAPPVQAAVPVYAYSYPYSTYACFSTDTWLTTPSGKKRMGEVKIGDWVLTANRTNVYFTPITSWLHRESEYNASFVTIMTEYGKMLRITPKHLIYRNQCGDNYAEYISRIPQQKVYAEELRVGDCLMIIYKGKFHQQKIKDIWITERQGIFAPMTGNGRLFVNDILASCHSDLKEAAVIQHKFIQLTNNARKYMSAITGAQSWKDMVSLPLGVDLLLNMVKLVTPGISY